MKIKLNVLYAKSLKYINETFIVLIFFAMWTFELWLMVWSSIYRILFGCIYEKPFEVFAHSLKSLYGAVLINVLQFGIVYEILISYSQKTVPQKNLEVLISLCLCTKLRQTFISLIWILYVYIPFY